MNIRTLSKLSDIKMIMKIGLFVISLMFYIISSQTHGNSVEFDDSILNQFPGITGYINHANFQYGGNNFYGTFFLLEPGYSTETITMGGDTKTCTKQIRGLYYNNQRGNRLRPLDIDTLNTLKIAETLGILGNSTGYSNLTITGGRYTLCSGGNPDEIYGEITHDRYTGTIYKMIAGVNYNTTTNSYTGGLSGTLKFFNNTTGKFWDQRGGVADFWGTGVPSLTQTGVCTGVVTSGVYYNGTTSYSINQIRNGTSRLPSNIGHYEATPNSTGCDFNCMAGYERSGSISQCTLVIGTYCGDGIIQTPNSGAVMEQCDDGNTTAGDGCSSTCTLETPTCTLVNDSPKYTGQNVTFTGTALSRSKITEISFGDTNGASIVGNQTTYTTTHSYTNTGTYTGFIIIQSNITGTIIKTGICNTNVIILGLTGTLTQTGTCSGSLVSNATNNSTSTGYLQTRVGGERTPIYSRTYNTTPGICTFACNTNYSRTGGACIANCGNGILNTGEQCDDGNTTAGDGCSSACTLETPTCNGLTVSNNSGYAPLSVIYSGTKNSRTNYTLNFGDGSSTGTFTLPLTHIYSNTGTYTYSLTGVHPSSGSLTCIQTGTITSIYSGVVCRNGRTNISGTCVLISTGNTSITGTVGSGSTFTIPGNITIYSSGSNTGGYLQISGINSVGISYGNRDGILIPPTILSAGSCSAPANTLTSISSGLTNPSILLEFQAGASGSTITSNITGSYFKIKVKVNSGTIGNTYRIFRSVECGTGREKVYSDELCILDSNKMCEFNTNKLSYFNIVSNSSLGGGGTPMIVGTIPWIRKAYVDKAYMSDPFTIANFNDVTLASVSKGMLYVNGDPIGESGYVYNGDELNIELYSSKKYDTTVSSTITIGSVATTFYITTMEEGDDNSSSLSTIQKIRIMSIFNLIKDIYSDNPTKEQEFLYTLRSMVEDKLDILDEDDEAYPAFEYLLGLIESHLIISGIDESDHIAPNCKEYEISYDDDEGAYYSPDFKKVQYFSTRETLIRYIDSKNPGDCRINTYGTDYVNTNNTDPEKHIAPNGKVYKIESTSNGYTSSDFTYTKYFDTIEAIRSYINVNNPAITIWDHTIDNSFDAINHIAPNGKVYKVYKTDKGYMSYKLIKVRYFSTLESIKSFIDQNNKI
ncbi:DUF4215 domain-containing protein [Candidatus Gracilibacteria bacterium]|nr:DUF4215 domain-containing protein [Candidatus Gracilibacteria bacterium]